MEQNTLLVQFTELAHGRKKEIAGLQTAYLLKQVENEMIQERFRTCGNKVLSEHCFYAAKEYTRNGKDIAVGDRITDCTNSYLMSETDFDEYQRLCLPEYVKDNLTDAEGRYTEEGNTEKQLTELKDQLIKIGVEILPDNFPNKKLLQDAIEFKGVKSYDAREKIFELVMQLK